METGLSETKTPYESPSVEEIEDEGGPILTSPGVNALIS